MSVISGVAKKYDGTAIDYVSIFNWSDGKCIAQVLPDVSGAWGYEYFTDLNIGITYVADDCQSITYGPYVFAVNYNDHSPRHVINSSFINDMTDLTGRIWAGHGNANVSNEALQLDGNGDYLDMPYTSDLSFSDGVDVTIRFKATIDAFGSGVKVLLTARKDNSVYASGPSNWVMYATVKGISFGMWNGTNGGLLVNNEWSNVYTFGPEFELSFERKGMVWRLYINGVQQGAAVTQTGNYKHAKDALLTIGSERNSGPGGVGNASRDLKGSLRKLQILKGIALGDGGLTTPIIN